MKIEYDKNKSIANKIKHGIDFEEARKLWDDDMVFNSLLPFPYEERYLYVGNIDGKMWTAIVTCRDKVIRLISVRRARKKEIQNYENEWHNSRRIWHTLW